MADQLFLHLYRVSIHRPHTRPDSQKSVKFIPTTGFNSQASYEARRMTAWRTPSLPGFQFTGLIRGPTHEPDRIRCNDGRFNSQASYEARLERSGTRRDRCKVSIHRPHTRPDVVQSDMRLRDEVSIHRPHTRPDTKLEISQSLTTRFNSQASYEARLRACLQIRQHSCFNSQASYEARLYNVRLDRCLQLVSIHRPHTRPDFLVLKLNCPDHCFNSQASYEARLI